MKNRLLIAAGSIVPLLILSPLVIQKALSFGGEILPNFKLLLTTNEEARRIKACGDLTNMGYGYLKRITDCIPDATIYPVTRHRNFYPWTHLLLPGRRDKADDRLLVGIDIDEADVREGMIVQAIPAFRQAGSLMSVWAFMTDLDYDQMTGIQIEFETPPSGPVTVQAALLRSKEDHSVLGEWTWPAVTAEKKIFFKLDPPVRHFSFGRGSTPFLLMLKLASDPSGAAVPSVGSVGIAGVKINLEGYTVIHTDARSFTAMRNDFLQQILSAGSGPWMDFLMKIKDLKSTGGQRNA